MVWYITWYTAWYITWYTVWKLFKIHQIPGCERVRVLWILQFLSRLSYRLCNYACHVFIFRTAYYVFVGLIATLNFVKSQNLHGRVNGGENVERILGISFRSYDAKERNSTM